MLRSSYVKVIRTSLTLSIAKVLEQEGFIYLPVGSIATDHISSPYLLIGLKYNGSKGGPYITNISRVSTPGQRVYCSNKKVPRVLGGFGIAVRLNI